MGGEDRRRKGQNEDGEGERGEEIFSLFVHFNGWDKLSIK